MRLPESKIKEAILHPIDELREQALHYFSDVYSPDPTIMPLVIQAVEKYGRGKAFSIMRDAEHLAQTDPTVEWLMRELRRSYDLADLEQDNYRFAIALALTAADTQLLAPREQEIIGLPAFPELLRAPLHERIEMAAWPWDRCWEALLNFGIDTMRRREFTQNDLRYAGRLVEALARDRDNANAVLSLLKRPYKGKDRAMVLWLEPQIIAVAGELRLEAAIPLLMRRLTKPKVMDDAFTALERIGTDAVVEAIDQKWWGADQDTRCSLAIILESIHTDESVKKCRVFLAGEHDPEVQLLLANSLLGNFEPEAIDLCWPLVADIEEDELNPEERDFRYRLVAVSMIMGKTFPMFEEWKTAALRDNWGWFKREHSRLADNFQPDVPGPEPSMN